MAEVLQLQQEIKEIVAKVHDITYFDTFVKPEDAKSIFINNPIYFQGINDVMIHYINILQQYVGNLEILNNLISKMREIVCVCYCINFYVCNLDISRTIKKISIEDGEKQKYIYETNYFIIQCRKIRKMLKKYMEENNISIATINTKYPILDITKIIDIPEDTFYPDFVELDIFEKINEV